MSKKFVNGYDKPRFVIYNSANVVEQTIDISFKYEALREYYEDITILDQYTDGSKESNVLWYDYEWRLFFTGYIEKSDRLKIAEVEKACKQKKKVILTPHTDYLWRYFEVIVLPEKRTLDLFPHHRGGLNTTNNSFEISFINKYPITEVSVIDPDYIPVIGAMVGYEYY